MTSSEVTVAGRGRRATAADVARLSGVSRATVSYVLNNAPGQTIPVSTQERVRAAAAELGYVPSAAAASLRRGHSRIILIVTEPALFGFITDPFLSAISSRLTHAGFVPVTHQYSTSEALRALVAEIRPYGVLALIALDPEFKAAIHAAGVPRVYSSGQGDASYPRPWEEEIGEMQAHYLIDRGAERLVYAMPSDENPRSPMARSRAIGVATVCKTRGLTAPTPVKVQMDAESSLAALGPVVASDAVTGICAFDDEVASVVLAAMHRLGKQVPGDVLVMGVDDTPFAPFLTPPLTSMTIDGRQTGLALADRFLAGDNGASADSVSHAVATIVRRGSA